MLDFKRITIEDKEKIDKYLYDSGEISCDTTFINLLVWQNAYGTEFAEKDGNLFIKMHSNSTETFSLPFGENFERAMNEIKEYCNGCFPEFYAQEGPRFEKFKGLYGSSFLIDEYRDAFDYIYLSSDLANLSGKKYHSKRNHISSFSKKYDWKYERIEKNNIDRVIGCAEKWYSENTEKSDLYLRVEHDGLLKVLQNMEPLGARGGAITINGDVVAFSVGSPVSEEVFDVHYEKALSDFAEAYTVINREFVRNELTGYKYINREDDMGLDGLRKAKLSYKPTVLLKKYFCKGRVQP